MSRPGLGHKQGWAPDNRTTGENRNNRPEPTAYFPVKPGKAAFEPEPTGNSPVEPAKPGVHP